MNPPPNKFLEILYRNRYSKHLIYKILRSRASDLTSRIAPHLNRGGYILDIGSASCTVTEKVRSLNFNVVPLDVQNYSIVEGLSPTLYDGDRMPFKDNQFDTSLILFVLHHTHDPEKILTEAMRVSKKIIVFEDIVLSPIHKMITSTADMLINLEFFNQPHTNKSDSEWLALFHNLDLKLLHREYQNYGIVFRHAMYVVEK